MVDCYFQFCAIVIFIVTTGASCLGELLKVNNSLQDLDMRYNVIGDDGMSSVADGLQYNKTLTKLNVWQCGFSVKGTSYLAIAIMYKTEFKIIWLLQFTCSCSVATCSNHFIFIEVANNKSNNYIL